MTSEKNQLLQLKAGSYSAFDTLYNRYFNLLYGFVFRLTRSHDATKNIVQEAFIKVWIHRGTIDPDESFKAWLFKISKNLFIDEFRARLKDPLFEDYMNFAHDEHLSVTIDDTSLDFELFRKRIQEAKEKLSPRQSQAFHLCREQGLAVKEVAHIMQISEQAVYNYLSQSLTIIRKALPPSQLLLFLIFFR